MKKLFTFFMALILLAGSSLATVNNYTFTSTSGTYTLITGGMVLGTISNNEQVFNNNPAGATPPVTNTGFPIGFNFTYDGNVYDKFAVNTNGWIVLSTGTFTIGAISGNSTPISTMGPAGFVNAISALGLDLQGQSGSELSFKTEGVSPNQVLTVQWKEYRYLGASGDNFNFQIKLYESTNEVQFVFGTFVKVPLARTVQVGIRGATNADYHNRTTTTSWASTTQGTINSNTCPVTPVILPSTGLTFTFSPFISLDFGDSPSPYPTLLANNGARHINTGLKLGNQIDIEANGFPDPIAMGDDNNNLDDEDGVWWPCNFVLGHTTTLQVTASGAGFLNAWFDYNANGNWADPGEQIFTNTALTAGINYLSVTVPQTAVSGSTFARFRFSTQQNLAFTGQASDGEVEDYQFFIEPATPMDYGDAPDPNYPTLALSNGARHATGPPNGVFMGNLVDYELNGQPNANANGDDNNNLQDEDGVVFNTPLNPGLPAMITVTASLGGGFFQGWIDFNADGDWSDPGEQIFTNTNLIAGAQPLNFNVPANSVIGNTYARFRYSTMGNLSYYGCAPNGEVEDYGVPIIPLMDYGDAPDPRYPTYLASNGARHSIVPGFHLGSLIDPEPDGLSNNSSTGDDVNNLADEDGVTVNWGRTCGWPTNITVNASAAGILDAWWDFGMNGWGDPGEQIFTSTPLVAGNNILNFVVPPNANRSGLPGYSSRFRFSQQGGLSYTGQASSGEVEDYAVYHGYADEAKWKQPVDTNLSALHAHDATNQQIILADDFYCWEGNVSAIRWFGTYEGTGGSPINHFHLSIHNNGSGPCQVIDPEIWGMNVTLAASNQQSTGQTNSQGELIYSYQYILATPLNLTGYGHYWLDISVTSNNPSNPALWKWQETARSLVPAICSAVSKTITGGVPGPWSSLYWVVTGTYTDLAFQILSAMDFGDAPAPYPTLLNNSGACHGNDGTQFLGMLRDTEPDGQPGVLADGDDNNPIVTDDEDGVTFTGNYTPGGIIQASVIMGTSGVLQGFADFNADGDWSDAGEWVIQNQSLSAGAYNIPVPVPPNATIGFTYLRFRVSTLTFNPSLTNVSTGYWPNGEVEDYRIEILGMMDYGDAPDPTYPTLLASNGARHTNTGLKLGNLIDVEPNGQPNAGATGDDNNPPGLDDEDGISWPFNFVPGHGNTIRVIASGPGYLNAWMDFNNNGTWEDPAEKIFSGQAISAGINDLSMFVPANAVLGNVFARFRFSSTVNLAVTGLANDGEVEDYQVTIQPEQGMEYGDAPDSYKTLAASNGARHDDIGPNVFMGVFRDLEMNSQPNATASGDDVNPLGNPDDEDGVIFFAPLIPGLQDSVSITVNMIGGIQEGWIDFNGDGNFNNAAEHIIINQMTTKLISHYTFNVPAGATSGKTYARFRYSTQQNVPSFGPTLNGEVEDYMIYIGEYDLGDAPDPNYPTKLASNGAIHKKTPLFMGISIDAEPDGQPDPNAWGDDNNPAGWDDEDGVWWACNFVKGYKHTLKVTTTGPGCLNAWFDYNIDGDWADANEQVFTNILLLAGTTELYVTIPGNATAGSTFARFRFSSQQNLADTGYANDGEVEDYAIEIEEPGNFDLGDAPDPGYPTLGVNDGARHYQDPTTPVLVFLGNLIDTEPDGQPNANAKGDDNNNLPDEDGVIFLTPLIPGLQAVIQVTFSLNNCPFQGWIDFNANGVWSDPGEQIFTEIKMAPGVHQLNFLVPANAVLGNTYARFRYSTMGGLSYYGCAPNGEVEDYMVTIVPAQPGNRAVWHLDENTGNIAYDATIFNNDGVITGATWTTGYSGSALNFNGQSDNVDVPHSPSLDITGQFSVQAWIKASGSAWYYAIVDKLQYVNDNDSRGFTLYLTGGQLRLSVYSGGSGIADVFGTSDLRDGLFHHVFGSWDGSYMRVYVDGVLEGEGALAFPPASSAQDVGIGMRLSGWGQYMPFNGIIDEVIISTDPSFDVDFGDAPDPTYPTLGASNGARHKITQLFLGASVDAEVNGLPHPSALGDDNNNLDDEDGIVLPPFMKTGLAYSISVTASQAGGYLQGWIDFNRDGDWGEPGEQVFTNVPLPVGVFNPTFNIPAGASLGKTYARFRLSTIQNLSYTGYATDGEVEDYVVYILNPGDEKMHWVQYPDLDPTGMDVELTWVPTADDFMCTETGPINKIRIWGSFVGDDLPVPLNSTTIRLRIFSDIPAGIAQPWSMPGDMLWTRTFNAGQYTATIVSNNSPEWWYDPAYQTWQPNNHQKVVRFDFDLGNEPYQQVMGNIYWLEVKRFEGGNFGWKTAKYDLRFNDDAVWYNDWPNQVFPGGWNPQVYPGGEIPHPWAGQSFDMAFQLNPPPDIEVFDFGDAPDPNYPTLLASNGARHAVDGITFLGATVDTDPDGQPVPPGLGDDNDEGDDEDGVTFDWPLVGGNPAKITVVASTNNGFLNGWVDFNADGDWADPGEQVFTDLPLMAVANKLHFFVPLNATPGISYARFRFSTQLGLSYLGAANDGEVEDYQVEIVANPDQKWFQLPDVTLSGLHAHDGNIPPYQSIVMADDWQCNGGNVTDIHWWGNYEVDGSGNEIKGSNINHFHISIHNQTGATCLPTDPEIWGATIPFAGITEQNTGLVNIEGSPVYLYEYVLPTPFNQVAGNKYWLDITAFSNNANNPAHWRWQEAMRSYDPILCGAAKKTNPNPGTWSTVIWNNFTPPKFSDMAFVITSSNKTLNLKLYLEGLYNTALGAMNQAMDVGPLPKFGPGIADQVTVELHNVTTPFGIAYTYSNVDLHTNGTLAITTLPGSITGSYYIVIKHRNSIETWSMAPVSFAGAGPVFYDFSTAASQAFGNNLKLMSGVYVIYGADPDQSGTVDGSDMVLIDNASQPPVLKGYVPEDLDGSGTVDGSDMLMIDNNSQPPVVHVKKP